MRRWLILGALVVGFAFLILTNSPSKLPIPRPAPDFLLPDVSGQSVRLSQLKGKVVLVNVWATWCAPCRQEMPTMQTLHQRLKNADFVMLAVSQDADGEKVVQPYIQKGGFTFPVLLDMQGEVGRKYAVAGYPETFIISRQGDIVHHHIGYNDWSQPEVEAALRRLINEGVWGSGG